MKPTKLYHRKMGLLALAGAALLAPALRADTITPSMDELIVGFQVTSTDTNAVGYGANLEVDLGNVSQFYNATPGTTFAISALSLQDLTDVYGSGWSTRTDLVWGAIATTGRATGTADAHAPVGTLWATQQVGTPPRNRGSVFAQKNGSVGIETMIVPGANGTLYGATSTTNSAQSAVIDGTLAGSWTAQDMKTPGNSFGYFNPTVDLAVGKGGQIVLALYEYSPSSVSGTPGALLGNLILDPIDGLSFQAIPEPSVGMLVALGLGSMTMLLRRRKAARG